MKAFIFSLSAILIITASTIVSGLYVKSVTDRLIELEKTFPEKQDGESSPSLAITKSEELFNSSYGILTAIKRYVTSIF